MQRCLLDGTLSLFRVGALVKDDCSGQRGNGDLSILSPPLLQEKPKARKRRCGPASAATLFFISPMREGHLCQMNEGFAFGEVQSFRLIECLLQIQTRV